MLQQLKPEEIAQRLREIHKYSDSEVNGKKVSDRIRYLKQNGMITLPPTNSNVNLKPKSFKGKKRAKN